MTIIVPAVLGGVAITVMALVSMAAGRKRRLQAARAAAAAQPRILVHAINDDRCTGCDACVSVCPTNVLDLVKNKSRVLRFQDCIQCEACMWSCPTEALVMHLEGREPPKLKVPELDDNYQTAVPGQYLIGEVAGKPLVKNAANIGRGVVEHMLATGLRPGALSRKVAEGSDAKSVTQVDVAIVGSGPGGLSAALTCIQRGLSYVVLEKEQIISSTIARYPKGKLVMAEPYDTVNLSLLPVFDSSKEELLPIWQDLVDRIGMQIRRGEAVEAVQRRPDGLFDVRTTVGAYRSQRVVLATGTRGKPRTLGVPGENLPKVNSLLEDPDEFRGQAVLVVGGGDSAVEAALALADAGAKVLIAYRGRQFSRAQAKNRSAIESYAAQKRVKIKYQATPVGFDADTVTLQMADGSQKKYPNQAAFVLIGADPPIKWLNKLGIEFVERPHSYALPASDAFIRRFVQDAIECPQDAASAAAQVAGRPLPAQPARPAARPSVRPPLPAPAEAPEPVSGPRKWLRSATSLFGTGRQVEKPMPLSEFARRSRGRHHTGHGRRDELDPGERTRVLRMLRDEGGRLAHDESAVYLTGGDSNLSIQESVQESPMPEPRREVRPISATGSPAPVSADDDSGPKQAVIVGLARAMAEGPRQRRRRRSSPPPPPTQARPRRPSPPPTFNDESTKQIDTERALGQLLRETSRPPARPTSRSASFEVEVEESTRAVDFDPRSFMGAVDMEEPTEAVDVDPRFLHSDSVIVSKDATGAIDIDSGFQPALEESTRTIDLQPMAQLERSRSRRAAAPPPPSRAPVAVPSRPTAAARRPLPPPSRMPAPAPRRPLPPPAPAADPRRQPRDFGPRAETLSDVDWDLD